MLTDAQLTTLRTACFADPTASVMIANGQANELHDWFNTNSTTLAWNSRTPVFSVIDAIDWSKYTPAGAVDDSTLSDALTAARRQTQLLAIQTKQMNLQLILQGRDTINATKDTLRLALRDATTSVPAGANGSGLNPGGANAATTLTACTRYALQVERLFGGTLKTTGATTATVLNVEGEIDQTSATRIVFKDDGTIWTP